MTEGLGDRFCAQRVDVAADLLAAVAITVGEAPVEVGGQIFRADLYTCAHGGGDQLAVHTHIVLPLGSLVPLTVGMYHQSGAAHKAADL